MYLQIAVQLVHHAGDLSVPVVHVLVGLFAAQDLPLGQRGAQDLGVAEEAPHSVHGPLALREDLDAHELVEGARVEEVVVEGLVDAQAPALLVTAEARGDVARGSGHVGLHFLHADGDIPLRRDQMGLAINT